MENTKIQTVFRKELNLSGVVTTATYEEVQIKYKRLAYKYAHMYTIPGLLELDDLLQCCYIAMWKCYNYYKLPYNYPTVAKKFMKWEMLNYRTKIFKQVKETTSYDQPAFSDKDGSEISILDTLGEEDATIENFPESEISQRLLESLSERQRDEIKSLFWDEDKKKDIAKKYNISYSKFVERSKQTINRFRMLFIKEGVGY